ncbi:MAG TPA: HdeD family acid-resistance protein [Polyangiales bacterium]|jgi:uncharacterized membrane protein HdeD (DUF308 family)|nr:HdeD family acid-resistance protein [Polyangiales bacterium]
MRIAVVDMETLASNWGAVLFRGLVTVGFGIVTLLAPGISLAALVLAFGVFSFADGVLALISALRRRGQQAPWWMLVLQGVAGIAAGVVTLFWPGITAMVLVFLIAAWALVTGAFQIATAIRLRKTIRGEWLLILSGALSVALGIVLALFPGPGALGLVIWIGAYALVSGVLIVALSVRLRSWAKTHEPHASSPPSVAVAP